MIELGQLEAKHEEFEKRQTRVIVVSVEDQEAAKKTQAEFPHLVVVSDKDRGITNALDVIHEKSAMDGSDTSAPATLIIDKSGTIRWTFRPERFFTRLSPAEVVAALDKSVP
jgi:peroxiredoxin